MAELAVVIGGSSFPLVPCPAVDPLIALFLKVDSNATPPLKAIARKGVSVRGMAVEDETSVEEMDNSEASSTGISPP